MIYLLYNARSKNGCNPELQKTLEEKYGIEEKKDVIELDYKEFIKTLKKNDKVILTGGDGTLHHFANYVNGIDLPCNFYFYSSGTGNDFKNDMKDHIEDDLILLNDVVKNLPTVIINDKEYKFINGVGFGIDGYCCEVGDEKQAKSTKPVNYASIAIKGLLFHYKRPNAKVTVDGETKEYKKVWLAPTMKGKYYGGGMLIAPDQDRFNSDRLVTNVVMHKAGKLHTLMVFPKIFKGEHVKRKKMVDIRVGKHVIVEFTKPTALQIDGETIKGVLKYEVKID